MQASVLAAAMVLGWATGAQAQEATQEETERELRGVSVLVGGGVEGYTGSLVPRVSVGPAWNLLTRR